VLAKNFESKRRRLLNIVLGLVSFFILPIEYFAQEHEKGETIFGLEVKAILPTSIFDAGALELGDDSIAVNVKSPSGYSMGMIIRHNFTKMFTLESGIHYASRNYPVSIENANSGFNGSSSINLVSYEIPIQWLLYIRLGEQVYMNTIFGFSMDFFPSDVTVSEYSYAYYIQRDSWVKASLLASIGFEYRTKESGYFYLGASVHSPFGNIGQFYVTYYYDDLLTEDVTFNAPLNGTYFSVEFRYFFNKGQKNVDKLTN
jgi:hypothetical protein